MRFCGRFNCGLVLCADYNGELAAQISTVFLHHDWPCSMAVVRTGQEVIRYLQGEGRYADRVKYPLPTLVILDLKIRRMDAFKILGWVRNSAPVRHMAVIVVAESTFDPNIARAYAAGANSFLVKSPIITGEADGLYETIEYWMGWAGVPVLDTNRWLQLLHNLPLPKTSGEKAADLQEGTFSEN